MMERDGDDFGPLYFDHVLKPCSSVKEPHFSNDQNPSNFHATSDLSANAYKDLKEYDEFLLSECGVAGECGLDDDFNDVIFDVEMEQLEAEFDSRGLDVEGENDKMVEENEFNVVGDMMDEDDDVLELYAGIPESFDMVFKHNEKGVEDLKGLTDDDICVNEEDSESDESLDIIIEDTGFNDDCVGSDKKDVVIKELGLLKKSDYPYDLDDLEPGEIAGMKTDLGTDVEARVGRSNQSFHAVSKGVRSVFPSQTIDAGSKGEQNQVNPVRNAAYNYGVTRFRYLPTFFKKAFNIEDDYSGYKPWTRPGVYLSDFFNFDLDEEKWQNYCKQMKLLLQTSPPSKAVGYKSEQLQPKNALGQQIGEAIQVHISSGERVSCLEIHHQRKCDSDAIIEIVCVDSPDDSESFTKGLRDRALHEYKARPTTIHKIINGDKILPFPLDGSFHQISREERTSHRVSMNYAQEGRQWTDFESMVSKKKNHISNQDRIMHLDHPKERTEAEKRLHGELVKCDKVMPICYNKDASKNNEGQTTVRNRLEDNCFHNSGEKSWRQGDSNYKKSLKRPDESKPAANVYVNKERTGNRFDNCRMRIEETLSQTDYLKGNNDELKKGSVVDKDNSRMRIEETSSQTDHQEENTEKKLNKGSGSAVDEDNYRMRIGETLSQTEYQEGNNDNKLNKGSAVDKDKCRMRIQEPLSLTDHQKGNNDNKFNMGSAVQEGNFRMRREKTLSQTDHQEGNNDKMLNMGSAVDKDNCRIRIEETLSQTDPREGNNDNKLNNGCAADEDNCRMRIEETLSQTDHQEGNIDKKLNMGSAVGEDICRMRIEESLFQSDHQEGNDAKKLNKGSADDKDDCRMIEETLSQTDHQEGNIDKKLNMGSVVDEDICRMRIEETLFQTDHQEGNDNKKLNMGYAVREDNCRMRIEQTLSLTDHQEGNNDNKLNMGSAVDEDICRMRIEETLYQTDHQEKNDEKKLNKGSAVDEDNCRMRIEETLSQTADQEENNDIKLNMGSAVDKDICRMRIEETLSQTDHQEGNDDKKLNMGSAVGEDNCKMRIEEIFSQTDQQEGKNDYNMLNKGSAVDEDNCRMTIEETLSQTDQQEGKNDYNMLNKGRAVDEEINREQATEPIDNHEQEIPNNCSLVNKLGNNVIFDDQKHEVKRGKNVDEGSKKMQGSPKARECHGNDMKQLMSDINGFMSEIDELVGCHKHEHRICCLR